MALGALRIGIDVVGHAIFLNLSLQQGLALIQLGNAAAFQRTKKTLPMRAHGAFGIDQFVVGLVGARVIGKQIRHETLGNFSKRTPLNSALRA